QDAGPRQPGAPAPVEHGARHPAHLLRGRYGRLAQPLPAPRQARSRDLGRRAARRAGDVHEAEPHGRHDPHRPRRPAAHRLHDGRRRADGRALTRAFSRTERHRIFRHRRAMIRMFRTVLPLFALLALVAAPAQAQRPYDKIETPPLPDFNVPEAERVELPNGMLVFLIEDHELPLVNVSARVGVGSVYEPADKVGLVAITGAVMRTGGSEAMTGDAMNAMLEDMGAIVEINIGETS